MLGAISKGITSSLVKSCKIQVSSSNLESNCKVCFLFSSDFMPNARKTALVFQLQLSQVPEENDEPHSRVSWSVILSKKGSRDPWTIGPINPWTTRSGDWRQSQ